MWANRFSYAVFILDLPPLSRKSRLNAVMLKLGALYPQSCRREQVRVFKNGRRKNSWIVCVFPPVSAKKKEAVSSLTVAEKLTSFEGIVWFQWDAWLETLTMRGGGIESSSVSVWDGHLCAPADGKKVAAFAPAEKEHIFKVAGADGKKRFFRVDKKSGLFSRTRYVYRYGKTEKARVAAGFTALLFALCFVSWGAFTHYVSGLRRDAQTLKLEEERRRTALAEEERQKIYFETLKQEFTRNELKKNVNVYTACSLVYANLGSRTHIDNLSIAGNSFQLDARDTNSLEVLRRFEENERIQAVKMNRTTREGSNEYFSLSGELIRPLAYADDSLNIADQIAYYERILSDDRRLRAEKADRTSSGFAESIRALLVKYACNEEYMQYTQTSEDLELECSMRAASSSFLRFLRDASNMCDFSAVRIKNNSGKDEVSVFIRIKTGMYPDAVKREFVQENGTGGSFSIKPEEVARAFFTEPPSAPKKTKNVPVAAKPESPRSVVKNPPFLQYLGTAGTSQGLQYVFIKNTRDNELYTLPLDSDAENSCRLTGDSQLEVRLGKELYEVHK